MIQAVFGWTLSIPGIVTVSGRAHGTISNNSATPITFTYNEILSATKKTTSTTDFTASLINGLLHDLEMTTNILGFGLGLPTGLTNTIAQALEGQAGAIDQILASTLTALGVKLGSADVWVTGLSCGNAVLVN